MLRRTLETLRRFDDLPDQITGQLDAGYDSQVTRDLLNELGCDHRITSKCVPAPIQGGRWVVSRTNSWHNRGFRKLHICTEVRTRVINAFIALANAVIIVRRLISDAWIQFRWNTRPTRRP